MALGKLNSDEDYAPMGEINVTPLVDVMLVLLVIFLVTAPLITQSLPINLPKVSAQPATTPERPVTLAIDKDGQVYWEQTSVNRGDLFARLQTAVATSPELTVQISADRATPYEFLAEILAEARLAGVAKVGFVTEPKRPQ